MSGLHEAGVTVEVLRPTSGTVDVLGNAVPGEPESVEVENVLVAPGATEGLDETRPDGVTVALTLHFPKTYTDSLRGCQVRLSGVYDGLYEVVGDPKPYEDSVTPGPWDRPVEVSATDG